MSRKGISFLLDSFFPPFAKECIRIYCQEISVPSVSYFVLYQKTNIEQEHLLTCKIVVYPFCLLANPRQVVVHLWMQSICMVFKGDRMTSGL